MSRTALYILPRSLDTLILHVSSPLHVTAGAQVACNGRSIRVGPFNGGTHHSSMKHGSSGSDTVFQILKKKATLDRLHNMHYPSMRGTGPFRHDSRYRTVATQPIHPTKAPAETSRRCKITCKVHIGRIKRWHYSRPNPPTRRDYPLPVSTEWLQNDSSTNYELHASERARPALLCHAGTT